jgi:ureidoglycolate lyase
MSHGNTETKMLDVRAQQLTASTCPKGLLTLISPTLTTNQTRIGNGGTSTRTADIAPCVNNYDRSSAPGRPILSSSRNIPFPTYSLLSDVSKTCVDIKVLERHPYTTQSFIPMGGHPDELNTYVVVVANSNPDDSGPDLSTVRAFTVKGNEGVCYGAAVWHAPMCVVKQVRHVGSPASNSAQL